MDDAGFNTPVRRIMQHTTRRSVVATLLGGVLLAREAPRAGATREAKRRKARRKRGSLPYPRLRPVWFWIENPGDHPVVVSHGDGQTCCKVLNRSLTVPPRSKRAFSSGYNEELFTRGFVWINERFWISVNNLPAHRPALTAAVDGQATGTSFCCLPPPAGINAVTDRPMSAGDLTSFSLGGHSFWVKREKDTNYLVFSVILPATLGPPPA